MGGIFSTVEPPKTKDFSIDNPNSGGRFFAGRSFFYLNEVTEGEHILSRLRRATVD